MGFDRQKIIDAANAEMATVLSAACFTSKPLIPNFRLNPTTFLPVLSSIRFSSARSFSSAAASGPLGVFTHITRQ